ncbi:MAG: YhbY family RNA-binding protein [Candidatus Woesearchaeota archaeon]
MEYEFNQRQKVLLYELKKASKQLDPVVRIGKAGVGLTVFMHISTLLKKRRVIKIKILKNCLDNYTTDDIIAMICEKCHCVVVDKIGQTFCVCHRKILGL